MSLLSKVNLGLADLLEDKGYRNEFFRDVEQSSIASQIRYLRELRGFRQSDLAEAAEMKQSAVSRLESDNYSGWSFNTLLRLAVALDARVKVTFQTAEEVIAELRAEWEAERLEIPPHKHYSTPLIERLNGPHEWGYRDPVEGGFIADMSPFEASDRLSELEAERPAVVVPREEQIKQMVTRFLGWKLPVDFYPDDGISFEPFFNIEWNAKQGKPPQRRTPTGTNLFNATQAEAMVRYMLGDDT